MHKNELLLYLFIQYFVFFSHCLKNGEAKFKWDDEINFKKLEDKGSQVFNSLDYNK